MEYQNPQIMFQLENGNVYTAVVEATFHEVRGAMKAKKYEFNITHVFLWNAEGKCSPEDSSILDMADCTENWAIDRGDLKRLIDKAIALANSTLDGVVKK
jgi:hypothetical protein